MPVEVQPCAEHAGIKIVLLSGRIDMADSDPVRKTMAAAIEDSEIGIVVDMADLEFISSSGFRALICARKDTNAASKTGWTFSSTGCGQSCPMCPSGSFPRASPSARSSRSGCLFRLRIASAERTHFARHVRQTAPAIEYRLWYRSFSGLACGLLWQRCRCCRLSELQQLLRALQRTFAFLRLREP